MKLSDIKVGESYAYSRGRTWFEKVTVVGIHLGGQLPQGFTCYSRSYWSSRDFTKRKVALVENSYGRKQCIEPRMIKEKWDVHEEQEKKERKAREAEAHRQEKLREKRKQEWKELSVVILKLAGVSAYRGIEYGDETIQVTAKQIEKLIEMGKVQI